MKGPVGKVTRVTYQTSAREIAEALLVPVMPYQWIELEPAGPNEHAPWSGQIHIVVCESEAVAADE